MAKKLTLSIDEAVIEAAKKYANKQGTSLSNMVENFFRNATGNISIKKPEPSETPNMDKIRELRKKMRTPEEQEKYLQDLYKQKPYLKERFEMMDKKFGYSKK